MKTCYIYVAGGVGVNLARQFQGEYEVLGFVDPYMHRCYKKEKTTGLMIYPVSYLKDHPQYDVVFSADYFHPYSIRETFTELGLPVEKLNFDHVVAMDLARLSYVRCYAGLREAEYPDAAVAELGVYKGDFAEQINRYFPKRTLYLFDTFRGFDTRDLTESEVSDDLFTDTSSELVMRRMPHPENIVLCEGYFPETTKDVDAQFLFVSLDPDLTKPIISGLKWFWPRMVPGGVILVHDYFLDAYPHVREAVGRFIEESGEKIRLYPIGDGITAAVCKPDNSSLAPET